MSKDKLSILPIYNIVALLSKVGLCLNACVSIEIKTRKDKYCILDIYNVIAFHLRSCCILGNCGFIQIFKK